MRGFGAVSVISAFTFLATGCQRKATSEECRAAMDHALDLALANDPSIPRLSPAEISAVREMKGALKLGDPTYRKVHDQCQTAVTKSQATCAMAASSVREWESCINP